MNQLMLFLDNKSFDLLRMPWILDDGTEPVCFPQENPEILEVRHVMGKDVRNPLLAR
jgi:hypothetical protein